MPTQSRNTGWGKTCKREFGVNCCFKFCISNLNITILLVSLLLPDFEQINKRSTSCSVSTRWGLFAVFTSRKMSVAAVFLGSNPLFNWAEGQAVDEMRRLYHFPPRWLEGSNWRFAVGSERGRKQHLQSTRHKRSIVSLLLWRSVYVAKMLHLDLD